MSGDRRGSAGGLTFDPSIVRGYDVRGYIRDVVAGGERRPQNLTPELALAFGRAVGTKLAVGATVAVTSDHRALSSELVLGLTRGFTSVGVNVLHNTAQPIYGGERYLPTGALSWFLVKSKLDGAVQVTGSHNPPEFNGFKISLGMRALFGEQLQELVPLIERGAFRADVAASERGQVREVDMLGEYLAMLGHAFLRYRNKLRVVVDAGNGIGRVITPVLRAAGCEVEELFAEPIASFPNHLADPSSEEGTRTLRDRIRSLNTHLTSDERPWLGIALDGDSDRSGFVDEHGDVVWPERMAAVFYADYLRDPAHAGHVLALDVRGSNVVRDAVVGAGGRGVFIPAGYPMHRKFASLTSAELGKTRVEVSAEASGHFFFPTAARNEKNEVLDYARDYLIDDGVYSALRFLTIVDAHPEATVRGVMSALPTYATSNELRLYVPDEVKGAVVRGVRDELLRRYEKELAAPIPLQVVDGVKVQSSAAPVVEVDGIRLQFTDDSWLVVRISNTSPNIVIKFEAPSSARLLELMHAASEVLAAYEQVEAKALAVEIARFG